MSSVSPRFVYLAGPIKGCKEADAKDWRRYVAEELDAYGIAGISPLRCEPIVGERYGVGTDDPKFGIARAIMSKNLYDVKACDAILAYIPDPATVDDAIEILAGILGGYTGGFSNV